jgi:hypothetical protein
LRYKRQKEMAGKHVNNLAGRKSDPGRRPEKEWQKIGIKFDADTILLALN